MSFPAGITLKPLVKIPKDANDCWKWLGKETQGGYGVKIENGKETTAARWIWNKLFGELPAALRVIHTCGNCWCVNPAHMRAGTQADACRSGVQTKLLPKDVAEIRAAKKGKMPSTATILAERYGVDPSNIREIWRGGSWSRPGKRSKNTRDTVDNSNGVP